MFVAGVGSGKAWPYDVLAFPGQIFHRFWDYAARIAQTAAGIKPA
jgi:hypothetical protein